MAKPVPKEDFQSICNWKLRTFKSAPLFLKGWYKTMYKLRGVLAVSISKPLLLSPAGAGQKYSSYLDVELKRKELVNELDKLKKKRRRLETDVDGLVKSADEFAQKAEDTRKLVWITKSNSLRRTAKEKEMTRKDIEDKIANVEDELKKT